MRLESLLAPPAGLHPTCACTALVLTIPAHPPSPAIVVLDVLVPVPVPAPAAPLPRLSLPQNQSPPALAFTSTHPLSAPRPTRRPSQRLIGRCTTSGLAPTAASSPSRRRHLVRSHVRFSLPNIYACRAAPLLLLALLPTLVAHPRPTSAARAPTLHITLYSALLPSPCLPSRSLVTRLVRSRARACNGCR